jgi:hypothetical protein
MVTVHLCFHFPADHEARDHVTPSLTTAALCHLCWISASEGRAEGEDTKPKRPLWTKAKPWGGFLSHRRPRGPWFHFTPGRCKLDDIWLCSSCPAVPGLRETRSLGQLGPLQGRQVSSPGICLLSPLSSFMDAALVAWPCRGIWNLEGRCSATFPQESTSWTLELSCSVQLGGHGASLPVCLPLCQSEQDKSGTLFSSLSFFCSKPKRVWFSGHSGSSPCAQTPIYLFYGGRGLKRVIVIVALGALKFNMLCGNRGVKHDD